MSARTNLKGVRGTHFKDRNPFWASIPSRGWDDNRDDLRAVLDEIRMHGSIGHSCIGNESSWHPPDSRHRQSTWRSTWREQARQAEQEREREAWQAEQQAWRAEVDRKRELAQEKLAQEKLRKIEEQCGIAPSREEPREEPEAIAPPRAEPGEPIPVDLLPNMLLNQPLKIGKARVWHEYVMIREEGLPDWVADEYRASFPRVWSGHAHGANLIIFRRPQEQTNVRRVA